MTVNDSRRIGISRSHNAIQLSIVDVVSNDAGRYVCMAQNTIATSNTSAVLQVIGTVLSVSVCVFTRVTDHYVVLFLQFHP